MLASAGSVMHNFKKRFRSSANPCASGVSVALRTRRLMYASDSGVCNARRRAISIARSRALPLTVSCTRPFLSASRGLSGLPIRMCMSAAGVPMVRGRSAAGAGKETKLRLRQSDQVVAILSDTEIAGERELECAGQGRAGNGGDDRLRHALAQRHGLVEESPIVGRVVGPLATGSAQRLCDFDKCRDIEMTVEIAGRAACHDNDANARIAREFLQRLGERV